jgi:hypothetical protein
MCADTVAKTRTPQNTPFCGVPKEKETKPKNLLQHHHPFGEDSPFPSKLVVIKPAG